MKEKAEADRKNEIRNLDEARLVWAAIDSRLLQVVIPLRKFLQSSGSVRADRMCGTDTRSRWLLSRL